MTGRTVSGGAAHRGPRRMLGIGRGALLRSCLRANLWRYVRSYLGPRRVLGLLFTVLVGASLRGPSIARAEVVRLISDGSETFPVTVGDTLHPLPGWPVWLKDYATKMRTEKTSGIAFAGGDGTRGRWFVLADEIGFLRFCRVHQEGDTGRVELHLEDVAIGGSLEQQLAGHELWDFEAVSLDPALRREAREGRAGGDTLQGFLSVEGQGEELAAHTRLLELRLVRGEVAGGLRWRAESAGDLIPGATIWSRAVGRERGFKGLAHSARFVHAGLFNLGMRGDVTVHGTLLFLYDRVRGEMARIPTAPYGIYSIGGLEALSDTVTLAVDRSRQALSVLRWDPEDPGTVAACQRFFLDLPAPGGFRYGVPTVEGVTVDERGGIWCVVDPWRGHYRAVDSGVPETLVVYLAAEMPILYRFSGDTVWDQAGLGHLWARPGAEPGGGDDEEAD